MTAVLTAGGPHERAALSYAERDWRVLVLAGKKPHGRLAPHAYKSASTDPDVIRSWWREEPDANIGIACAPSGLVVIDADYRDGGDDLLRELERKHGALPRTPRALTGGGGTHDFLRHPSSRLIGKLGTGLDVRDRAYVVVPPSLHPNGRAYSWELDPAEVPLAPVSETWLDLLRRRRTDRTYRQEGTIPRGRRNDTLTRHAGGMRRMGLTTDEILPALDRLNANRCQPALPADEVARIAASIGGRPTAPPWALDAAGFAVGLGLPLTPTERHVLIQLCRRAKDDGTVIGGEWVERETGHSRKTIYTALQSLLSLGVVRRGGKLGRTNTYRIVDASENA